MARHVYYSAGGHIRRTLLTDWEQPYKLVVQTEIDLSDVERNNRELAELHPRNSRNKLIARGVPATVWEQSIHEQWDEADWAKWLNDPDNKAFRVWPGRV